MNAPISAYRRDTARPDAFDELAAVRLVRDVLTDDEVEVPAGTVGTVVGVWADGAAYEVEFKVGLATVVTADLAAARTREMDVAQFEIRQSKVDGYLLAIDHPDGGSKAKFFLGRGFRLDDYRGGLTHWPRTPCGTVQERIISAPYGVCPDGNTPEITAIWKVETGSATATLVTAYPKWKIAWYDACRRRREVEPIAPRRRWL